MRENANASLCRYIALDIHKHYSVIAGVDRDGQELLETCRVEHEELEGRLTRHLKPSDRVVIEIDDQRLARVRSAGAAGSGSAGGQPDQGQADRLRTREDGQEGYPDPCAVAGG